MFFTTLLPIFILKGAGAGAGEKKVPGAGAGAGQKSTGSATLQSYIW